MIFQMIVVILSIVNLPCDWGRAIKIDPDDFCPVGFQGGPESYREFSRE